jgi:hypothetical protein
MTNNEDLMQRAFCDTLLVHQKKALPWYVKHRDRFRAALRTHLFFYGYLAYARNDMEEARVRFREGVSNFPLDLRARMYLAATHLPTGSREFLKKARRMLGWTSS